MLVTILLACIAATAARTIEDDCIGCIKFGSTCYSSSHIVDIQAPFRDPVVITKLGLVRLLNRLYYAFEPLHGDTESSKIGYVDLNNPETESFGLIYGDDDVYNFHTFAIDQVHTNVHFGCDDGIYSVNSEHKGLPFSQKNERIVAMHYYDQTFFIKDTTTKTLESEGYEDRIYESYKDIINFVFGKDLSLVYVKIDGIYLNKFHTNDTVRLSPNSVINGLEVDINGVVYVWWMGMAYKVVVKNPLNTSKLVKVAEISNLDNLVFDKDNNILINAGRSMYKLTPAPHITVCPS